MIPWILTKQEVQRLQQRASEKVPDALVQLAKMHMSGAGIEQDFALARRLLQQAVPLPEANYLLGVCCEQGLDVTPSEADAFYFYSQAANLNHPLALYAVGEMSCSGRGTVCDCIAGAAFLARAAAEGVANAFWRLDEMIECGVLSEAKIISAVASALECTNRSRTGAPHAEVDASAKKNAKTSIDALRAVAFGALKLNSCFGDASATTELGACYERGLGVYADPVLANALYWRAANSGSVPALLCLGDCLLRGVGTAKCQEKALECYQKAADAGNAAALCRIADVVATQPGREVAATNAYKRAAEAGSAAAWFQLSRRLANGIGAARNAQNAYKYLNPSAQQNFQAAVQQFEQQSKPEDKKAAAVPAVTKQKEKAPAYKAKKNPNKQNPVNTDNQNDRSTDQTMCKKPENAATNAVSPAVQQNQQPAPVKPAASKFDAVPQVAAVVTQFPQQQPQPLPQKPEPAKAAQPVAYPYLPQPESVIPKQPVSDFSSLVAEANQGNSAAQFRVGNCYFFGHETPENKAMAAQYYGNAANSGNPDAIRMLTECARIGGLNPDCLQAVFEDFLQRALQSDPVAQVNVGYCVRDGIGTQSDAEVAEQWFEQAAQQGNAHAMNALGCCYISRNENARAFDAFNKAVEGGFANALANLGNCYMNARGVYLDKKAAVECYKQGAEAGSAIAQCYLAEALRDGQAVEQNLELAAYWSFRSAVQGFERALNVLDIAELKVDVAPQDAALVFSMLYYASKKEIAHAQYNVGICYERGFGGTPVKQLALRYLQKARENGHLIAASAIERISRVNPNMPNMAVREEMPYDPPATTQTTAPSQPSSVRPMNQTQSRQELFSALAQTPVAQQVGKKQIELAQEYARGTKKANSVAEQVELYKLTAPVAGIDVLLALADCHYRGTGVPQSIVAAADCMQSAALYGSTEALATLNTYCSDSQEAATVAKAVLARFIVEADAGNVEAQYCVGYCYYNGVGTQVDYESAVRYLQLASVHGHRRAARLMEKIKSGSSILGSNPQKPAIIPENRAPAEYISTPETQCAPLNQVQAVLPNYPAAQPEFIFAPLANGQLQPYYPQQPSYSAPPMQTPYYPAAVIAKQAIPASVPVSGPVAISQQVSDADVQLALDYAHGVKKCSSVADEVQLYERTAPRAGADVLTALASCYFQGRGVACDVARGVECLQVAALYGSVVALGMLSTYCVQNKQAARAALLAFEAAACPQNVENTADTGDVEAYYCAGYCYRNGVGTPVDPELAYKYLYLAAARGHKRAARLIKMGVNPKTPETPELQQMTAPPGMPGNTASGIFYPQTRQGPPPVGIQSE